MIIRNEDGAVHFSDLKQFAQSPLHYLHSVSRAGKVTRQMSLGTIVHHMVLGARSGRKLVVYDGKVRNGKYWDEFSLAHRGDDIVIQSEWNAAAPVADALMSDRVATQLIGPARKEIPLAWEDTGISCATSGVDLLGEGYLAEVKTTSSTEPRQWKRHAMNMLYHAQLAFYQDGARASGEKVDSLFCIGVAITAPHCVTVLELTEDLITHGRKLCGIWFEQLRQCEENNFFPPYALAPVSWDVPPWAMESTGDDT